MNGDGGTIDPQEKQRLAAAEIARRQVLGAYQKSHLNQSELPTSEKPSTTFQNDKIPQTAVKQDINHYHNSWSAYYQKYYHEYYTKAAHNYVAAERKRLESTAALKPNKPLSEAAQLREKIRSQASDHAEKVKKSKHFLPLVVGLTLVAVVLFLQYSRFIVAPIMAYISPGNMTETTIQEIDPTVTVAPGPDPKLIIPKLNVEVPVAFGISNETRVINDAMRAGVAHFMIPGANAMPGEVGNLVISGHSGGSVTDTINSFKFIFSGLTRLVPGDLMYINYQSVRYTYIVSGNKVVEPTDVDSLIFPTDKPTLTLITCTPLGSSRYRLLVFAEQVKPDPSGAPTQQPNQDEPDPTPLQMPSNPPTLFTKIWNWLTGGGDN